MIMRGVIQIRIANGDDQQQVSDRKYVSQRMVLVHLPAWITRGQMMIRFLWKTQSATFLSGSAFS